jgi:putative endonuclease
LPAVEDGTLYIAVTSNLIGRIWQHKNDVVDGFTNRYGVHLLVWLELHESMESALLREKAIKGWKREWKIRLIEEENPYWVDLYSALL